MGFTILASDQTAKRSFQLPSLFSVLLFIYFFTLHADQLSCAIGPATFRLNNLIALLFLGVVIAKLKRKSLSFDRLFLGGLVMLTCTFFISTLLSQNLSRSLLFLGWWGFIVLGYVYLPYLLITHFSKEKILKIYFLSFFCVGIYATVQFLLPFMGIFDVFAAQRFNYFVRPNAFAYEPSYLALYMTPFMVMWNLNYFFKGGNKLTLVVVNFFYLISTAATTIFGYLLFGVALMPFLMYYKELKKRAVLFFLTLSATICTLFFAFPSLSKHLLLKFFFFGIGHHSFSERWVGIKNCFTLFLEHPFFGVGLGTIPSHLFEAFLANDARFHFLPHQEAFFLSDNPLKLFEPSNVTMEILGSLGIFGLGAFLFLVVPFFKRGLSTLSFQFVVSTALMLGVLQFNQGLFRTYVWVHFSLSYAWIVLAQTKQESLLGPKRDLEEKMREISLEGSR